MSLASMICSLCGVLIRSTSVSGFGLLFRNKEPVPKRKREEREKGERGRREGGRGIEEVIRIRSTTTPLSNTHIRVYAAGLDYVSMTRELTFQPSTTSVCGNVGRVKDDVIVEGAESFFLLLSSQNDRVHIQYQDTAQVTIEDDDGMCVCTYAYPQRPHSQITGPHSQITGPYSHITGPHSHITRPHSHITGPHSHITGPHSHITGPHFQIRWPHPQIETSFPDIPWPKRPHIHITWLRETLCILADHIAPGGHIPRSHRHILICLI